MSDRLFSYGAPLGGYIDPVTGKLTLDIGGRPQPAPQAPPIDTNLITAPGMGQGTYPEPLAKLRQWFDPETYGPTGGATWEQPSALLPMAMHPGPGGVPEEKPAIPRAIKEGAQFGLDLLASPWTGGVPESTVGNAVTNALFRYGAGMTQPAGVLETFMGKTGKHFPTEAAARAEQMLKEGMDRSHVYQATGVGKMKSTRGNPFFEISDQQAQFRPHEALNNIVNREMPGMEMTHYKWGDRHKELLDQGFKTTLGEVMPHHPELYANRPDLAQVPVHVSGSGTKGIGSGEGFAGGFNSETGVIELSHSALKDTVEGKKTLLHELGHKIAFDEGWARGTNPAYMQYLHGVATSIKKVKDWAAKQPPGTDLAAKLVQHYGPDVMDRKSVQLALNPNVPKAELARYERLRRAGDKSKLKGEALGNHLYNNLAGEWMSRMVEHRSDMGTQELRDWAPWDYSRVLGEPPEQAQIVMKGGGELAAQRAPEKGKPGNLFFDFGRPEAKPTGRGIVPQQELPRFMAKSTKKYPTGYSERMEAALGNSKLETALKRLTEQGIEMGGQVWYDAEPLRQAFVSRLGEEKGTFEFNRLMQFVGATSPQQKVPFNVRTATAYYIRDRHIREGRPGAAEMPVPWQVGGKGNWKGDITEGRRMPSPYGGYTQGLWQTYAQNVHHGRPWPLTAPKPPSFAANLTGNIKPYTADMHDIKQIGILSGDPRWLTSDALKRGVTPKTAGPDDWVDVPNIDRGEYVGAETLGQRLAKYFGIPEAHVQAARWIAGGKLTGLGSDASKSFMDFVMDRLEHTAKARKITPIEALNRLIDGDEALLAETGLTPGMGQYLAGEKKQPPPTGNRLLQTMGSQS